MPDDAVHHSLCWYYDSPNGFVAFQKFLRPDRTRGRVGVESERLRGTPSVHSAANRVSGELSAQDTAVCLSLCWSRGSDAGIVCNPLNGLAGSPYCSCLGVRVPIF